jgi:hypothetical protein
VTTQRRYLLRADKVAYRVPAQRKYRHAACRPKNLPDKNPPDGAIINYYLKDNAARPITLEIIDSKQSSGSFGFPVMTSRLQ